MKALETGATVLTALAATAVLLVLVAVLGAALVAGANGFGCW